MTPKQIKILKSMSIEELKKQFSVTKNSEIKDYISELIKAKDTPHTLVECGEIKIGEV